MSDTEKPDGTFVLYRDGWPMDVFAYRDAIPSAVEVVRRDPAVLAELPEVKAIVDREMAKLRAALAGAQVALRAARGVIVSRQEHALITGALVDIDAALQVKP